MCQCGKTDDPGIKAGQFGPGGGRGKEKRKMTKIIEKAVETLRDGGSLSEEELNLLAGEPLPQLRQAADALRKTFCGDAFDLCTIFNGKSGRCSEDCKYCAQSACYETEIREYPLLSKETIVHAVSYTHLSKSAIEKIESAGGKAEVI